MDHGGSGFAKSMAAGESPSVDHYVASWRRALQRRSGLRADDVDELCDHFHETVMVRIRAGASIDGAVGLAHDQLGDPEHLITEMGRVSRPPAYLRRWCLLLTTYALMLGIFLLLKVAMLTLAAYQSDPSLGAHVAGSIEMSVVEVLVGLGVMIAIALRSGLLDRYRGVRASPGSWMAFAYIFGMAVVLFFGVVLIEYWEWWLVPSSSVEASEPWDMITFTVGQFVGAPIAALTVATSLSRWHPALRERTLT